jgi:alpha-tubulin suppressor-like RCC1 family protein
MDGDKPLPTKVPMLGNIRQITAGDDHTCALATTGDAFCWGGNSSSQIGNGTTGMTVSSPTGVSAPF